MVCIHHDKSITMLIWKYACLHQNIIPFANELITVFAIGLEE